MKVGILGVESSKFGELWDTAPRTLVKKTVQGAIEKSHLKLSEIEAIFVGNMLSGILGHQENLGAFFSQVLNLNVPAFKVEGACASGGLAFHNGYLAIRSELYKKVLVVGVEKMTDYKSEEVSKALMSAASFEERTSGLTFPGLYAILANAHMRAYKTTEEEMAMVAVKNHYHGSLNPKAHFQMRLTLDQVLESTQIASPFKLFDCSPISDGCSVVVLTNEETVNKKHGPKDHRPLDEKKPVWILSSAVATDSLSLCGRKSLTTLSATVAAAKKAYRQANLKPENIDLAEVHDCFTIAEILALEDLGFYQKGKAAKAIASGEVTLGTAKKLVVNSSGGLKACGHPVGATGVKQIVEIVDQLRGNCGKRQVEGAKIGLTQNVGGSGAVAVVNILTRT